MLFSSEVDFMDSTDFKAKVGFDCLIGSSFVYAEFGLADIYVQKNYLEGR